MKTLIIGDPHGKLPRNLSGIIKKNKIELIICLGDIPYTPKFPWREEVWTKEAYAKFRKSYGEIIKKLCSYGVPVLILRGNMGRDAEDNLRFRKIIKRHKNLFYRNTGKKRIGGIDFIFFDIVYEPSQSRSGRKYSKDEKNANDILSTLKCGVSMML